MGSFDDPVRSRQHVRRNRHADLFRRLQIDDQFKLRGLLDGQFSRARAFENSIDKDCDTTGLVLAVTTVREEPTIRRPDRTRAHGWQPVLERKLYELFSMMQ